MGEIIVFPGPHAELFSDYVRYKHSLGYAIGVPYQYVLREIARLIDISAPASGIVSRAGMEEITARKPGEAVSTQCKRIAILRQFCIWLTSQGFSPAIPPEGLVRDSTDFVPRIVSAAEMTTILSVADSVESEPRKLLLRLLWCTGMRIGEACKLTVSNLDLHSGTIMVEHAKGDRTRLLPMSQSLWEYTSGYLTRRGLTESDGALPLLPTRRGNFPRAGNAGQALSPLFAQARVLTSRGTPIRPHDLRHSYAVHALEKMVATETDLYVALPLLATFMGHADIQSTEYYLRFTNDTLLRIIDTQQHTSEYVFGGAA